MDGLEGHAKASSWYQKRSANGIDTAGGLISGTASLYLPLRKRQPHRRSKIRKPEYQLGEKASQAEASRLCKVPNLTALYESLESILGAGSAYQIRVWINSTLVLTSACSVLHHLTKSSLQFNQEDGEKKRRRAQRERCITLLKLSGQHAPPLDSHHFSGISIADTNRHKLSFCHILFR